MASAAEDVKAAAAEDALQGQEAQEVPKNEGAVAVKDEESSNKELDPSTVKAPGLMQRTKEEVEAMAETVQEKLSLNKEESAESEETKSKASGDGRKEEQVGVFKRLLKKFGFKA